MTNDEMSKEIPMTSSRPWRVGLRFMVIMFYVHRISVFGRHLAGVFMQRHTFGAGGVMPLAYTVFCAVSMAKSSGQS